MLVADPPTACGGDGHWGLTLWFMALRTGKKNAASNRQLPGDSAKSRVTTSAFHP